MKRWLALALAAALTASLFSGCGASKTASGQTPAASPAGEGTQAEKTELKFLLVAGNDEMPGWEGIVESFNQNSPDARLTLEQLPGSWPEYVQKLTALIAADTPPDIGRLGAAYVAQFAAKGQLADLTGYVDSSLELSDYYETAFEQVKIDGKIRGIPVGIYTLVLYYNKAMFDDAGVAYPPLDWENPWTYEQFLDAAAKLTSGDGPNKQYGVLAQLNPERSGNFVFSNNANFFDADRTKATFNDPGCVEAYEMMQGLITEGYSPTPAQIKTMPADQMFTSNKLAMIIEGQWMMPAFTKVDSVRFGVAPTPKGAVEKTVNFIDQYVVFDKSKNHDKAWEAVKSFIGEEAEKIMVANNLGGIPVNKKAAASEMSQLFNPLTEEEKNVILQSIGYSQSLPFTPAWAEQLDTAMKTIDLVGLGKIPAAQAMETVTDAINSMQ